MDRLGRIIIILIALCPIAFAACGIGTETGNPELPPVVASSASDDKGEPYSSDELGIELSYADGWSLEEGGFGDAQASAGSGEGEEAEAQGVYDKSLVGYVSFSDGAELKPATVDIYVYEFAVAPASLAAYLGYAEPDARLQSYRNRYHSGYMIDGAGEGPNGGLAREIYFLKGRRLLCIVAELFDTGSGGLDAETIFQSVHITE